MSARDNILSAVRSPLGRNAPRPAPWQTIRPPGDLVARFVAHAGAAAAQVKILEGADDIPLAAAEILRLRNLPAILHLPPDPILERLTWSSTPGLTLARAAPGPEDAAMSVARFGIAETGTLFYPASSVRPASWHFRPGLEVAILAADSIDFTLEQVLARLQGEGALPSTVNLVTGPSRTGDIEQTLELGAHGPKELAILIVPGGLQWA